ncbi:BamA/TamA family outer membrane protein [Geminocystis sp.]|uniref:BamA/TamA family outer membrane protein n=1 Tax=Geminocystis sp. TaxID=2664100 RepID=UPI003593B5F4
MAVKKNKTQDHSLTANQSNSAVILAFDTQKGNKRLISFNTDIDKIMLVENKSQWQKTLLLILLSTLGFSFPLKAFAQTNVLSQSSDVVTASIAIPVTPPENENKTMPTSHYGIAQEKFAKSETDSIPIPVSVNPENASVSTPSDLIAQTETPVTSPQTPPVTETPVTPPQTPPATETPSEEARVLVSEVSITGVEGELKDLVYNTIRTNPGRTTTRSRLQEDINAIYATGYFSNVKVTPEDTQLGVKITFAVVPNPILQQVEIQTLPEKSTTKKSPLPPEVLKKAFEEQYGKILNLRDLQEGITEINKWYTDNGYDLAQVVGAPQISPDGVVTLIIAEGQLQNIQVRYFNSEQEEVKGKTREFIVTREIQLKPGDIFNRRTAQEDLQRVFGLGLFEDVKLSFAPGDDPSQVIMNVDVVENNTGSLAAGAGISSTSGLFGTVSYQERNLGGNNQTVGLEFQLGERELLFDVSFQDPWIGGDPYRTSYTGNIFRRRSISLVYDGTDTETIRTERNNDSPRVVRTGAGFTLSRPLAEDAFSKADWVLTTGFQYQHIEVQDSDSNLSPRSGQAFGNQKLAFNNSGIDDIFTVRFNASQDTRDNGLRPNSGSLLLLGMEQSLPLTSILFNRVRASYSYYLPLKLINFDFVKGPQTLAFNFQGGTVLGDLPPYEAFVIGGSNSVRGYGEGDLGNGRSFFQATAEYRFPIVSFLAGTLFFDYGTTLGSGSAVIGKPSEVRGLSGDGFGYGLGVRVQSPVGPIRIDYAINNEGDNRIHFGIGEKF